MGVGMPSRVSWVIKGALTAIVLSTLGFGQIARGEDSSEIVRKTFLEKYSKFAFAGSDRLLKPRIVPNISYACSNQSCRKTIEDLRRVIPQEIEQTSGSVLRSDTLIDVTFYADDADRAKQW
jgi:hypothetical protein